MTTNGLSHVNVNLSGHFIMIITTMHELRHVFFMKNFYFISLIKSIVHIFFHFLYFKIIILKIIDFNHLLIICSGIDMVAILEYLGLGSTSSTISNNVTSGASTFVVAYAIHKVFAPLRISITLVSAPFIVRYLRSKGILASKLPKKP